jgi:hypothetical protein
MWASDPDWGLVRAVTLIALAGALLLLEFRAYFCNSVIASTLVGLVFSILDLVLLAWISHIALVDEISFHAIVDRLDLASVVFILILISMGACPAIGHFAWARELERWARLRASFEQGSEIRI